MIMMLREQELMDQGRMEGRKEGEQLFGRLITCLLAEKREADIARAASDPDYREKLYREFEL